MQITVQLTSGYVTILPMRLMTLFLLILLMFNSVLPAIKIHPWSGLSMHDALVIAHKGEIILAVQRREESRLTTNEMLENSPESALDDEFDPQAVKQSLNY